MADTPVVLLNGARQTGKSTLCRRVLEDHGDATFLSLDEAAVLEAAREDPAGFVRGRTGLTILDEVQKAPELLSAIKLEVDRDRRPGRFLLTGSANVMLLQRVAESLAGRMEVLNLWPLSFGEIHGLEEVFVDALFGAGTSIPATAGGGDADLGQAMIRGGFPEPAQRASALSRERWFRAYSTTILQREIEDLAQIDYLADLPRLLGLLAARSGSLLNMAEISRSLGLSHSSLRRYLVLLEAAHQLTRLPAWSANLGKALVRSPKVQLVDSGLAAWLIGATEEVLAADRTHAGRVFEGFVHGELRKQIGWSAVMPSMSHFRTSRGIEVDFLLEDRRGRVVGVEAKYSHTIRSGDAKGLRLLRDELGDRFHRGVILYLGDDALPFGDRIEVVPVAAMWGPPLAAGDPGG